MDNILPVWSDEIYDERSKMHNLKLESLRHTFKEQKPRKLPQQNGVGLGSIGILLVL
jgi:hypothetical protein